MITHAAKAVYVAMPDRALEPKFKPVFQFNSATPGPEILERVAGMFEAIKSIPAFKDLRPPPQINAAPVGATTAPAPAATNIAGGAK